MPSCVIVVENLPVPFDRRVWQEAQALRDAGWSVSVICPANKQYSKRHEIIDNIAVYRHPLPLEASGKLGYVREYGSALLHEAWLLLRVATTRGFDVIQVCNPPDILALNALPYKLFGKKLVFDHHDSCPELFAVKFGRKGLLHKVMLLAERWTVRAADLVITANETYRQSAIDRCGKDPDDVVAVYSAPDRSRIRRTKPNDALRRDARLVLGYVGIIADQDGVDQMVHMMRHLTVDHGRTDLRAVVVGDGPALAGVRALADELGVAHAFEFTGYLRDEALLAALSTFDIGIIPDPYNEYNDAISMNKVFEYSVLGVPSVSYDLRETRRMLGDCGEYADDTSPAGLARAVLKLIDDDEGRARRGREARQRAAERFDWAGEREKFVSAYAGLVKSSRKVPA